MLIYPIVSAIVGGREFNLWLEVTDVQEYEKKNKKTASLVRDGDGGLSLLKHSQTIKGLHCKTVAVEKGVALIMPRNIFKSLSKIQTLQL